MTIRDVKGKIEDKIKVRNILVSVANKDRLEDFIPALVEINPTLRIMSTGGTFTRINDILGHKAGEHLIKVAEYTEFPEMEGGLVKTLNPKIHAGILGERGNPAHREYLRNLSKTVELYDTVTGEVAKRVFDAEIGKEYAALVVEGVRGVYLDMIVGNFYRFEKTTRDPKATFETARGNIDIGGPTMMRAAAKNFLSCAALFNPVDYQWILEIIRANNGCTTFNSRLALARGVFKKTAEYDQAIADYLEEKAGASVGTDAVRALYDFAEEGEGEKTEAE